MDFYFLDQKIYFWLLVLVVVLVVVGIRNLWWRKRTQAKFSDLELLSKLAPSHSRFKPIVKIILMVCCLSALCIGLVNPKMGLKKATLKREGIDVVFAIDVSKSMLSEDVLPSRLKRSKQLVSELINELVSDRVGIIAYASSAFPQLPITTDYGSAKLFLNALNTDMISSQGTAIVEALNLAKTYFSPKDPTNKVLVLISDGEDHDSGKSEVLDAAEALLEEGIRILTVGVGTAKGGPIPIKRRDIIQSYKKDADGEVVITRLDAEILEQIAANASGKYIDASNIKTAVDALLSEMQSMEKKEFDAKQFSEFEDQFQWFIALALLMLFIDLFVLERRTLWIRSLDLFNEKKHATDV